MDKESFRIIPDRLIGPAPFGRGATAPAQNARMRSLVFAAAMVVLAGCAAFQEPVRFPAERYTGETPLERTLSQVNIEANRAPGCALISPCQATLPSRDELARTRFLDCKGYAMAKAYALQDAGIEANRMRIAELELMGRRHVVLVVDERYVLDNLDDSVRRIEEYRRFQPVLAALPATLMAGSAASAGQTSPKR
jgi:hypothetical protein